MKDKNLTDVYNSIIIKGEKELLPISDDNTIMLICIVDDDSFELSLQFVQFFAQAIENDCDIVFVDKEIKEADINRIDRSIFSDTLIIISDFVNNESLPNILLSFIEKKYLTNKLIYISQESERNKMIEATLKIYYQEKKQETAVGVVMHLSGRKPFN